MFNSRLPWGFADRLWADLTPGMTLTIAGAAKRHGVDYKTAQKALRKLYREEMVARRKNGRRLVYEGKQERLL